MGEETRLILDGRRAMSGGGIHWGEKAMELIKELERNPDTLPPYNVPPPSSLLRPPLPSKRSVID